jgi:hypothetical protein
MKYIKQQLAYVWEHREAIIGLTILLTILFTGLVLLEHVIQETL